MGACSQLKLVLWKNIVLRLRQPVILALELLWPLTIFLLVLLLRKVVPPVSQETCYYNARALPSAGGLPVLQSLICNVDNKCLNESSYEEIPTYPGSRINKLVQDLSPLLQDESILSVIKSLPVLADLLGPLEALFQDDTTQKLLGKGLPLTDVVANKRYARSVLLSNTNMTPETVDALLESRINVPAVLHVLGSGMKRKSRRDCNVDTLSSYIMLEDARVLQTVADSLCSLSHEQQENLMKELQSVFDYGKVMKLVSQVVKSLGLDDFSLAMEKVGGMVTAFGSISEQMPSDFSGSLDALRALIQDFTDQQLNVDLLKAVWDDVGQVVPSPERELVNTIMEWISGSTGQIGPPNYGLDTPVSTSTPPSREGTLGNVLNTAVKLVNDFQSPSGPESKAGRFFHTLFGFDKSTTIQEMLDALEDLMSTKRESSRHRRTRQDAMYYTARLIGIVVEFMRADLENSQENAENALFPQMIESLVTTFSSNKRVNRILSSNGILNVACTEDKFKTIFRVRAASDKIKDIQVFTCHFLRDIVPAFLKTFRNISATAEEKHDATWSPMNVKISDITGLLNKTVNMKRLSYDWIGVSKAAAKFESHWNSKTREERITSAMKIVQTVSNYVSLQRLKYWNDFLAVFYMADQITDLLNQMMGGILVEGGITVRNVALNVPSMNVIITEILEFLPDFIRIGMKVLQADLANLIEKLEENKVKKFYVPCQSGKFADLLSVGNTESLRRLEEKMCQQVPLLMSEFFAERHVAAISTMVQRVNHGQDVPFSWTAMGARLNVLLRNVEVLGDKKVAAFADVSALHGTAMKDALKQARTAFGADDTPEGKASAVLQLVSVAFQELDANLNHTLMPYLLKIASFLTTSESLWSEATDSQQTTLSQLFENASDLELLVRWVNNYLVKLMEYFVHTLTVEPKKISYLLKQKYAIDEFCNNRVQDYLTVPMQEVEIATSALQDLCAINFTGVHEVLQKSGRTQPLPKQDQLQWFFEILHRIVSLLQNEEPQSGASRLFNSTQWNHFLSNNFWDSRSSANRLKVMAALKGITVVFENDTAALESIFKATSKTACRLKAPFWNLKWKSLLQNNKNNKNINAILQVLNASTNIVDVTFDTVMESKYVKAIITDFANTKDGLERFCSLKKTEWTKYFALGNNIDTVPTDSIHHLACKFSPADTVNELKSKCDQIQVNPANADDVNKFYDAAMDVYDELAASYRSGATADVPFLTAVKWKELFESFVNQLSNGLLKFDLKKVETWSSLLEAQFESDEARSNYHHALSALKYLVHTMTRQYKGSSFIPIDEVFGNKTNTAFFLNTWLPMLPAAAETMMSSLIVQQKAKNYSPIGNFLQVQRQICNQWNETDMVHHDLERHMFTHAICSTNFTAVIQELMADSNTVKDVETSQEAKHFAWEMYTLVKKLTTTKGSLVNSTSERHSWNDEFTFLSPWETFNINKALLDARMSDSAAVRKGIVALIKMRKLLSFLDDKTAWKTLSKFTKLLIATGQLSAKQLSEEIGKFYHYAMLASESRTQDADLLVSIFTMDKWKDYKETMRAVNVSQVRNRVSSDTEWIEQMPEAKLAFSLEEMDRLAEDMAAGYHSDGNDTVRLVNDEQVSATVMTVLEGYASRPLHSATRLFLSMMWMVHQNTSSSPLWNSAVPTLLDLAASLNSYFEQLPSENAYVAQRRTPSCPRCFGTDILDDKQELLRQLVSQKSFNNPAEIVRFLSIVLNVTDVYFCEHNQSAPYAAILDVVFNRLQDFPEPKELVCALPNKTATNAYKWISQRLSLRSFISKLQVAIKYPNAARQQQCKTIAGVLSASGNIIDMYVSELTEDYSYQKLEHCIDVYHNGTFKYSVERYVTLTKHLFDLAKELLLKRSSQDESLLQFLVNKVVGELPVYTTLSNIVTTKTLNESLHGGASSWVDVIENAEINLNWLVRHNFSQESFEQALCSSPHRRLLAYKSEEGQNLCDANFAEALARSLFNTSGIAKQVMEAQTKAFYAAKWLDEILKGAASLWDAMSKLFQSTKALSLDTSSDNLAGTLSSVLTLLDDSVIKELINSLEKVQELTEAVFPGGSIAEYVNLITQGLKGVQKLGESGLFHLTYSVQDTFSDKEKAKKIIKRELSLLQEEIDKVLKRPLDINTLARNESINNVVATVICDVVESQSNVRHKDFTEGCTPALSSEIEYRPFPELTMSKVVKNFADAVFDGVLRKSNLSKEVVKAALKALSTAPKVVPVIREKLSLLSEALDPKTAKALSDLNITQDGISVLTSPAALSLVGQLLCGSPLKALEDQFYLLEPSSREPTLDVQEIEELPSKFCRRGYEQVMRMSGGPIIWGFLKPILRGQILYAPRSPAAFQIMQEVNKTFESMSSIIDALHVWSEGTIGLKFLTKENGPVTKLKELISSKSLQPLAKDMLGDDVYAFLTDLSVEDLRHEFGDLGGLLDLVQLVGSISQCFELDRFKQHSNEDDLVKTAMHLGARREFILAVVFLNLDTNNELRLENGSIVKSLLPPDVQYKIRMDIDNVPLTKTVKSRFWQPGANDDFLDDMRYLRGFAHFQELIDRAITKLHVGESVHYPRSYLQQFPYPCYMKDSVGYYIKAMLPLVFTLAWIFLVAFFVRERVLPKELHLEEIMQVMGLKPWIDWSASFLISIFISIGIVACTTAILCYGGILPYSNPLLLFIFYGTFALSVIMFCYMISIFFKSATVASLTGIVGYLISFLPFVIAVSMEATFSLKQKLLLCLSMSTSFSYGCLYISRFEEQGLGVQWEYLWQSPIPGDTMNMGYCIVMMAIDSLVYFTIGLVMSNIFLGEKASLSRRKLLAFFSTKNSGSATQYYLQNTVNGSISPHNLKAPYTINDKAPMASTGISIQDLCIAYNSGKSTERIAVSHLSLNFDEGHINTLLGQNGAGKTSTIKVLTGQHSATSGEVYVYGRNVNNAAKEIRKYLGYCPQYNTLYGKLTVKEHLIFFGNLKELLSPEEVEKDVERLLRQMGLKHMENKQACHLSGGLQRRLCVAFSFVGGSKLVILDEPTSSVDPMARRNIWDLILKHKHDRTILLTTHHMDEADVLSDKVAIIHKGKLLCEGSPLLLKSKFGFGYKLSLTRSCSEPNKDSDSGHSSNVSRTSVDDDSSDIEGILHVIRGVVPPAQVVENNGGEVVISLPQRDPEKNVLYSYSHLLSLLDERMLEFGFGNYGLSSTTLEEVFLSLCALCDAGKPVQSGHTLPTTARYGIFDRRDKHRHTDVTLECPNFRHSLGTVNPLMGRKLKVSQFKALILKRFHHTVNNWKAIFFSIVLPCTFIAIAMGFTMIAPGTVPEPSLRLSTQLYGPGAVGFISEIPPTDVSGRMLSYPGVGSSCLERNAPQSHCMSTTGMASNAMKIPKGALHYTCHTSETQEGWGNGQTIMTETTDIVYNVTGLNIPNYLLSSFPDFIERRYGGWTFETNQVKVWYDNTGFHSMPAYQNALSNAILRSAISHSTSPLNASRVGITVYNHPLHLSSEQLGKQTILGHVAEVGIAMVVLMGLAFIPSRVIVYVVNERIRDEKQVQSISGVGTLLYWTTTFIWDMGIVLATVALSALIIIAFGLPVYVSKLNFPAVLLLMILFGWGTTPLMYCLSRLFKEASISFVVLYCVNLFIGLNIAIVMLVLNMIQISSGNRQLMTGLQNAALVFPQYALIGGFVSLAKNHIQADIYARYGQDTYENPFSNEVLNYNFYAMFLVGVVFFCINLFLECHLKAPLHSRTQRQSKVPEDTDVTAEKMRANGDSGKNDVLRVLDVVKVYQRQHKAVDNVSFGIPKGECFGLLGVNGAGKTTLFRILTGQLQPTQGTTLVQDTRLDKVFAKGTQLVGYCPQADALDDLLSPKEHLVIYSMMRGIPKSEIQEVVEEALARFQLSAHANYKVGTLSRGTRRKVCTAIAMLGNPQIVLLDEPTSGMDPVTRRLVWSNVSEAIQEKRSVLLTSHSMAECDLLCSRLAIMVNGQLCCIGSPQYLKHKFGAGFTVTIRMAENVKDWKQAIKCLITHFPAASLKAQHFNIMEFSLPSKQTSLSSVFKFLEKNSSDLSILDFSVSQTTLDQVFVNFARQQCDESAEVEQERPADTSIVTEKNGFISDESPAVALRRSSHLPAIERHDLNSEATKF
ncbi:uncharacterized protein LOC119178525 [Rhipicephalus microplus]|uniref:uncharacterized protein LOC119178525 n=1 Tax=Rhipicephalus microplus TaxID=6941 RepID=UPI003F6BCF36